MLMHWPLVIVINFERDVNLGLKCYWADEYMAVVASVKLVASVSLLE